MKLPLIFTKKTPDRVLQMRLSFFESEDSEREGEWIVVSNEIGLIVLQVFGVEHKLSSKSHVTNMVLFSDLCQIDTCFLYLPLREQCDAQIFHDQQVIRCYRECTLQEDNAFFHIADHRVCPAEIAENLWIIRSFQIRLFQILDGGREVVLDQRDIATQIQTSR